MSQYFMFPYLDLVFSRNVRVITQVTYTLQFNDSNVMFVEKNIFVYILLKNDYNTVVCKNCNF